MQPIQTFNGKGKNLTGLVFEKLTVKGQHPDKNKFGKSQWVCSCSCGGEAVLTVSHLSSGNTKSCGCGQVEARFTHGGSYSAEYFAWSAIKRRCFNKQEKHYDRYGGRGITMCAKWRDSFEEFIKDVGPRPSELYSIERENNDKNYEPGNVKWATKREQANNRSSNIFFEYKGRRLTLAHWCRLQNVDYDKTYDRLRANWTFEQAVGFDKTNPKRSI